jgi:hypothetical protein
MSTTPRVFVVQEPLKMGPGGVAVPRINYGTLQPFGYLKFLFTWGEITDRTPLDDTTTYLWRARAQLADFRDTDYLVPMGHPGLIAIATLAAAEANDGRIKILDWSRERSAYRVVQIDLNRDP